MDTTRDRILEEALNLFSEKGYQSVTVKEIARSVGIKAPSLYKHFKNKQDILDSLLQRMEDRYGKRAEKLQLNGFEAQKDVRTFAVADEEQLTEITLSLFEFFLKDPYMSKFRKMLRIERISNPKLAQIFQKQYIDDPLLYQSQLFSLLKEKGLFKGNIQSAALQFYAPVYLLMEEYDLNPDKKNQISETLETHVRSFFRNFSGEESE